MQSEQRVIEILNAHPAVKAVRQLATEESIDVYLYGGALRDYFLGITPTDLDFVVWSDPGEFARKINGLAPGETNVIATPIGNLGYYRGTLGKLDFIPHRGLSIDEFLKRYLDFTVNSVVFDVKENSLLYFNGCMSDLHNRVIKTVCPLEAMSNPANIPLRAVRLSLLTPGFTLDQGIYHELKSRSDCLAKARPTRIGYEFSTILDSEEYFRGIGLLEELGLLQQVVKQYLPCIDSDDAGQKDSYEFPLPVILRMYRTIDELIAPFEAALSKAFPKLLLSLRLAVFLTPTIRSRVLEIDSAERKPFLVARGEQIEKMLVHLGLIPGRAFRVRIIAAGYLSAIASVYDRTLKLEEAIDLSIRTFGTWKGFFAAILICADWLCSRQEDTVNQSDLEIARELLRNKITHFETERRRAY